MKYYCVWSDDETILCLTTDYGVALDVYGDYMFNNGYLTDDSWTDATASIEEFIEYPTDRDDIMRFINDTEKLAWKHGKTIML
jgi:hypothetical protein